MTTHIPEDLPGIMPSERLRSLKARHVSMIAFGGVIGAGLFVGSSAAIAQAGPAVLIAYCATGGLVVLVMRMLGEMLLHAPGLGSFVDYIRATLGPWAGFLSGWLYWFFWIVALGSEAIGGAILLHDWIGAPVWLLAAALIVLVQTVNAISAHFFGECEFWLSLCKVTCLVCFSIAGIGYISHLFGPGVPVIHNLQASGDLMPHGWNSLIAVIPTILFSMIGSEAATVAAAETENPEQNIERTTRTVGARITLFYILSIALIVCIVPWTRITPGHSPFVTAMEAMGIPGAGTLMRIVVLSAIISCLNSAVYITSRTLHGLSENGEAPLTFSKLSKSSVPTRAINFCCFAGACVAMSSIFSPDGIFSFLLGASGAVMLFIYMMIVCAHLLMRSRSKTEHGSAPSFKLPFGAFLHFSTLFALVFIIAAMLAEASQRNVVLTSVGTVAVISGFYIAFFKKRLLIRST